MMWRKRTPYMPCLCKVTQILWETVQRIFKKIEGYNQQMTHQLRHRPYGPKETKVVDATTSFPRSLQLGFTAAEKGTNVGVHQLKVDRNMLYKFIREYY